MDISIGEAVAFFAALGLELEHELHESLKTAGEIVCEEAKDELGSYQGAAGPTAAWDPLSPVTQADRTAQGFPADEPLLRTGGLRDSISVVVQGDTAFVGSDSPAAPALEEGYDNIPPRSFLEGAAYRKEAEVLAAMSGAVEIAIKKI